MIFYLYAIIGSLFFSGATVVFSMFALKLTSHWVVAFKNWIGLFAFLLVFILNHFNSFIFPDLMSFFLLFSSGFIGLLVGDLFLFKAFSTIGSSRTLMVFNLQPIIITLAGTFLFHQVFYPAHGFGLILMMACLLIIGLERYHRDGHWDLAGVVAAAIGVTFDAAGILMTRAGFEGDPGISPMDGNFYRFLGAVTAFLIFRFWIPFDLKSGFLRLKQTERIQIFLASFAAGFLSLALWLSAIKEGHLASLSGIAAFSPVGAALWEWVLLKRVPTPYWWVAFLFFAAGFAIVVSVSL